MEAMPYRPELELLDVTVAAPAAPVTTSDWRTGLPVLCGDGVVLRELRTSDAPSLHAMLTTEEVTRFISPPPTTVEGFEQFIAWTHRQRAVGAYVCFAVTLHGFDTAIGIFQVRLDAERDGCAEWGFAIGSPFWGSGVFSESAALIIDFVFEEMGLERLEARASVANGRGNGALVKLGAVAECLLRKSFFRHGQYHDQMLYGIIKSDWVNSRPGARAAVPTVH